MLDLKIIIGSTREGRSADRVHPWVVERARAHEAFDVDVVDLRDWPLPMLAETIHTVGDFRDPTYSDPIVERWNHTIKAGVFVSYGFRNKPSATVSYSNSLVGGARAIEHLAHMIIEADGVPLRNTVPIGRVTQAFGEDGMAQDPMGPT